MVLENSNDVFETMSIVRSTRGRKISLINWIVDLSRQRNNLRVYPSSSEGIRRVP